MDFCFHPSPVATQRCSPRVVKWQCISHPTMLRRGLSKAPSSSIFHLPHPLSVLMGCFLIFLPYLQPVLEFITSLQQIGYKCSFGTSQAHSLGTLLKGYMFTSNNSSELVRKHGFWGCIGVGDITPIGLCRCTVDCCGMCHRNVLVLLTGYSIASSI